MEQITVRTERRSELVEITDRLREIARSSGVAEGVMFVQSLHTTGALTINENADPDVESDVAAKMEHLVPRDEAFYDHAEGNSDSHVKTSLFGPSLTVLLSEGNLVLGRWQGVFFCEWDGPRTRSVAVQIIAAR
ncbi:secondary thiamine-phosphate synthase enzyme YjbQ [soil metagenome]